ncbi:hypothetical protein DV451_003433 [Geotrichum candidum]|uniref:Similar to Saccharomyces cerevisiae YLR196W PWP1 Protein with WD-40 repeats involved in rRNA processing n=1 Tax=Geotrichum candidum TaxID=1173061 RepID=A0A0J9XCD8_GEOCN|nr:hypothetical protein DV451_003433 [Geotrichum candidum]KAF5109413.1 hypothetical protein DV453_001592 [Geotrichum candidum]KAF5115199.1 hypothetical protein DV454_002452 [Geotrichum candidum]KAF5132098.1 hypothetical protein DV495_001600 [Geotrichum candidum]KAF7500675.1 hypothetical protein DV113_001293 [Geotrichum candidum]
MSIISSTTWVPRGFASEFPVQYDFDDAEMDRIAGLARLQLDDAKEDLEDEEENQPAGDSVVSSLRKSGGDEDEDLANDADLKEYDLEHYDDDEEETGENMGMFSNLKTLTYHDDGEKDPYISLPTAEEEEEERQEWQVYPTDNLILATRTEEELSTLEVYVFDDQANADEEGNGATSNLYVHHDIMLPSFPLCVERIDYRVGKGRIESDPNAAGNFAAVSTFEPEIEIWNLDVVDSAYPDMILGQKPEDANAALTDADKKLKKKKKKKVIQKKINDQYHVDAVLSLSHNKIHRNLLVSGSADTTVKLWDLNNGVCARNFGFHQDKVSAVQWNPVEGTILLSGGYDRNVIVSDLRVSDDSGRRAWQVEGDVEGIKWGNNGQDFYVSTENGIIHKFDARMENQSVWKLQAHDSEVTCFDLSPIVDGYMVSGSSDKTIKLWNLGADNKPSMILSRDLDVGKVFSVGFAPDREVFGHVVVAGSSGKVKVWDTLTNRTVREAVGRNNDLKALLARKRDNDKVVGVTDGNDSDESDDDEDLEDDESGDEA